MLRVASKLFLNIITAKFDYQIIEFTTFDDYLILKAVVFRSHASLQSWNTYKTIKCIPILHISAQFTPRTMKMYGIKLVLNIGNTGKRNVISLQFGRFKLVKIFSSKMQLNVNLIRAIYF